MRLCFIADANAANAISWLEYFANELGHELHVISITKIKRKINGVQVYELGGKSKVSYLFKGARIQKLINAIHPDLLIGYRIQSCGFLAARTGFHPLALATQCESIVWPPNSRFMKIFCQYAIKRADWINSWSENITQNLLRLGARQEIVDTYPRGVKTSLFFPRENNLDYPGSTIITTRSLSPEYHQDTIIKAIPKIQMRISHPIEYLVIGDGEMLEPLKTLSEKIRVKDAVHLVGYVQYSRIAEYLRKSDVYVSLVSIEGVSASLLEAMACGIFPIVPDIPANRLWIKDGMNGFLIPMIGWRKDKVKGFFAPPEDYAPLIDRIVTALNNNSLRETARDINVKMIREKASWELNMKRMEESYLKLAR